MGIKLDRLKEMIDKLQEDLGEGFVASDIWATADAQPLVGYNTQPKAVALLNEVTRKVDGTLKTAAFPGLGNYYIVHLSNGHLVVVLSMDTFQQFILVDLTKTTIGLLMNVALPNLLKAMAEAEITTSNEDTGKDKASNQLTTRFALRNLWNSWNEQWEANVERAQNNPRIGRPGLTADII